MKNKLIAKINHRLRRFKPVMMLLAACSLLPGCSSSSPANTAQAIEEGAILHAWCWSFDTIKEKLPEIAAAGFTAVQTSPINAVYEGEEGGMQLQDTKDSAGKGKWYYHYQPVDYKIGNYQLGSEEDFIELCQEAEKHGISIIVDAVLNHTTKHRESVSDDLKNVTENLYHDQGAIDNWGDRQNVTQHDLLGLSDLNTQDEALQQYQLAYLKKAVEDGADGFRFDAAKHIELEDDEESYAGSFWDVILDNGSAFQYGEILQDGVSRDSAYAQKMHITASNFGTILQDTLKSGKVSARAMSDWNVGDIDPSRLVSWVESHDNYCNDGTAITLSEDQVLLGWAMLASREGATPLFFSRPANSSADNMWGDNVIGAAGSDAWNSDLVKEINLFRKAMAGKEELLTNPMNNARLLQIERGQEGAVVVSLAKEPVDLESETVLPDGTYSDHISGTQYIVENGILKGQLPAQSAIVLYQEQ